MSEHLRRWVPWVACAVALVLLCAGRVLVDGSRELGEGERLLASGDVQEAIRHLRRAAHWYLPGSPYCARAYEKLEAIAIQAESQGRTDDATSAWRAIRASALATRWWIVPERARLVRANRHLAALMLETPQFATVSDSARAHERDEQFALLQEDHAPEPVWLTVMGIGLLAWIGAAFWVARRGWDAQQRPRRNALLVAAACVALGFGLFVLGIVRA